MTKHDNVSLGGIMKATEFVKKFGIHIADQCLNDCASPGDKWFIHRGELICGEDFDDLKRLVESHELVGNFGGLKRAKRILKKSYTSFNTMVSVVWNDKPFQCTVQQLEQAVSDVEACHEVN